MLIDCENCLAKVYAEVVASYEKVYEGDWVQNLTFSLCKCPQCSSPILIQQELVFQDFENDFEWGNPIKVYPTNLFHINPSIPQAIANNLLESIKCFKANALTASIIMSRKTLEVFCVEKGIKESNLSLSIKKLKETGIINDQIYEWADGLRLVGNKAAHDFETDFKHHDAKDVLDFTIAILDFTYSFKDKFENFKKRINQTKEPKSTTTHS